MLSIVAFDLLLRRIKVVPPAGVVLKEAREPRHDGVVPEDALGVVLNEVVFAFNLDEFDGFTENLQGVEELDALADGDVGVGSAMQEQ